MVFTIFGFFVFKQKTAYEMRISDWSSDVCSSDLFLELARQRLRRILVERLAAIDDDLVGARSSRDVGFLFARHPRDDARAERLAQLDRGDADRSEERRGGKEGVSTCRTRWSP